MRELAEVGEEKLLAQEPRLQRPRPIGCQRRPLKAPLVIEPPVNKFPDFVDRISKYGSIAVVERFNRTLKCKGPFLIPIPFSLDRMRIASPSSTTALSQD